MSITKKQEYVAGVGKREEDEGFILLNLGNSPFQTSVRVAI
jgi:hypothetical protein